ncbi:hypothetical protein [Streptomyces sp. NPDC020917]|uniref:hypothetical protein n=1 Tax=Streptomyces sp. NPDC020917 TaxID=3365102 RepID=UPI00378C14CB
MGFTRLRRAAATVAVSTLAAAGLAVQPALAAAPRPTAAASATPQVPLTTTTATQHRSGSVEAEPVCADPEPGSGEARCFAQRRTDVSAVKGVMHRADSTAAIPLGYGPADLLSAHNLPANGGAGATVAIVDAYDDPNAEADLAVYRAQYGLPACTTDNGCFKKTDQTGGSNYPAANSGWAGEISLDLDMVSAVAPDAHILLVEANGATYADLGASVDQAVTQGAQAKYAIRPLLSFVRVMRAQNRSPS